MFSVIASLAIIARTCEVAVRWRSGRPTRSGTAACCPFSSPVPGASWLAYLLGGNIISDSNHHDKPGRSRPSAAAALLPVLGILPISLQLLTDRVPWLHGLPVPVTYFGGVGLSADVRFRQPADPCDANAAARAKRCARSEPLIVA